jgi:hypothetical protein
MNYIYRIITPLLFLLFLSCLDKSLPPVVAVVDGNPLRSNEFFSTINRNEFFKLKYSIRREKIMDFVYIYLAEKEARKNKIVLPIDEINLLKTKKNQLCIDLLARQVIKPKLLEVDVTNKIMESLKTERFVSEIVVFHKFSFGHVEERSPLEARKLSQIIMNRLQSKNITFNEAVSIYTSLPVLKIKNGVVGFLPYGSYPINYCDAIWNAPEDTIIGPIETDYGYHIVQLGEIKQLKNSFTMDEVNQAILNGKYGVFSNKMEDFASDLRKKHNCTIDTVAVIDLYNKLELISTHKKMTFNDLSKVIYNKPIGSCNNEELSLAWFIQKANQHGQINSASIHAPIALLKNLTDILNRHLSVQWVMENNNINKLHIYQKVRYIEAEILKEAYIKSELEKSPELIESNIYNRLLLNHDVEVSEDFLNQN